MKQNVTPTSDWKVIEDHGNWEVKQRDIVVPSTESVQVCKVCGEEFSSFIVDHIRKEHGVEA